MFARLSIAVIFVWSSESTVGKNCKNLNSSMCFAIPANIQCQCQYKVCVFFHCIPTKKYYLVTNIKSFFILNLARQLLTPRWTPQSIIKTQYLLKYECICKNSSDCSSRTQLSSISEKWKNKKNLVTLPLFNIQYVNITPYGMVFVDMCTTEDHCLNHKGDFGLKNL